MWELKSPARVKLIIGILAADENARAAAVDYIKERFGELDLVSDIWPFTQTTYYKNETGENILRQFVTVERTISPGRLAKIKLKTNRMEQALAEQLKYDVPRPVNFDPGVIEPSKLVLASTKNFSQRIYIGKKVWAELTLMYDKGIWKTFDYTYPDYKQTHYQEFFNKVRTKLVEQLKSRHS
ncbi:MAG: DUF4416 family protein [Phycisphaerae bacterium]|nr:DUF4416 family protein [Phycisphaerae bacterium]